jgi:DNA polymerase-1
MLKEEQERVVEIVKEAMESAAQLSVPLISDAGIGTNWLEAH